MSEESGVHRRDYTREGRDAVLIKLTYCSYAQWRPPKADDAYSPFPPDFFRPLPSLRSRHYLIQLGTWGSAVSSPAGPPNDIWCILG